MLCGLCIVVGIRELSAVVDTVLHTSEWVFILSLTSQSLYASEVNDIRFLSYSGHMEAWEALGNPGSGKCCTPGSSPDLWSAGACALSTVAPGICTHLLRSCDPSGLQV